MTRGATPDQWVAVMNSEVVYQAPFPYEEEEGVETPGWQIYIQNSLFYLPLKGCEDLIFGEIFWGKNDGL